MHMCTDMFQGVGFVHLYKGSELSYTVSSLHHNREYKFRVSKMCILADPCNRAFLWSVSVDIQCV